MPFLLDTNIVSMLIDGRSTKARIRFEQVLQRGHAVTLSSIVMHELRYGASHSAKPALNHVQLDNFANGLVSRAPFDDDDAREAGDIRAALKKAGTPIGPYDVLIAGQARRRELTLVTANVREFKRVPKLKVENWL
jgi:tRNA(fMet)-specific endonuclease VapC